MRSPSAYMPADVGDREPANGLSRMRSCGSPLLGSGACSPAVCAAASRASNACATRSRIRSATSRFDSMRQLRRPRRRDRGSSPGSCPSRSPSPASRDVVGDEQVDALRLELRRRPVQAARLCGEPDEDRPRAARPARRRTPRPGEQVRGRGQLEREAVGAGDLPVGGRAGRKSATAAAMTSASAARPVRRGHRGAERRAELGGRLDADMRARRHRAAAPRRRPRSASRPRRAPAAASASATPILPVERLPM